MARFLVLLTFALTTVDAGSVTVPLTVTVKSVCMVTDASPQPQATTLTLKCTRDSVPPVSPIEVVAALPADWRLVAHTSSADGAELFTYTAQASVTPQDSIDFY